MPGQPLPLKDIKPIVDVPDHSLWLFAAVLLAAATALALVLFWLVRKRRGRIDRRRAEAIRRLDALDFGDTKTAVYDFSLLGHFVLSPETEPEFKALLGALEPYKYQKTVPPLPETLIARLQAFVKEARHG